MNKTYGKVNIKMRSKQNEFVAHFVQSKAKAKNAKVQFRKGNYAIYLFGVSPTPLFKIATSPEKRQVFFLKKPKILKNLLSLHEHFILFSVSMLITEVIILENSVEKGVLLVPFKDSFFHVKTIIPLSSSKTTTTKTTKGRTWKDSFYSFHNSQSRIHLRSI